MKRPLTLVIAVATAALAIAPLGLGTQAQAQVDVYIGKQQPQQGQLPPSTGPYGDRDRDGSPIATTITTIVAATGTINTAIGTPAIATAMALPTRGTGSTTTTTIRIVDSDACGYEGSPSDTFGRAANTGTRY